MQFGFGKNTKSLSLSLSVPLCLYDSMSVSLRLSPSPPLSRCRLPHMTSHAHSVFVTEILYEYTPFICQIAADMVRRFHSLFYRSRLHLYRSLFACICGSTLTPAFHGYIRFICLMAYVCFGSRSLLHLYRSLFLCHCGCTYFPRSTPASFPGFRAQSLSPRRCRKRALFDEKFSPQNLHVAGIATRGPLTPPPPSSRGPSSSPATPPRPLRRLRINDSIRRSKVAV